MKCGFIWALMLYAGADVTSADFRPSYTEMEVPALVDRQAVATLPSFFPGQYGVPTVPITESSDPTHPYEVEGQPYADFMSAAENVCSIQQNNCSQMANDHVAGLQQPQCVIQQSSCYAAISTASVTTFGTVTGVHAPITTITNASPSAAATLFSSDATYDYYCE